MSAKFPRGGSKPILSHPSIHLSKCFFVGNHMSQLKYSMFLTETNIEEKEPIHEIQNKTDIEPEDRTDEYYNIMSADKKSSTVIMLEDLTDFLLDRKLATQRLEEQFKVSLTLSNTFVYLHQKNLRY